MQAPSRGSILYAIEVPEEGDRALGNTYFASAAAAYAGLSDQKKAAIKEVTAEFSLGHQRQKLIQDGDPNAALTKEQQAKTPAATHRVVQRHPVTGKPLLYVNEGHTTRLLGIAESDAKELLSELCTHITQPEFVCCHQWKVGDVLMWDNVATQHLATFDYALPQRRYMHRTTLKGPLIS